MKTKRLLLIALGVVLPLLVVSSATARPLYQPAPPGRFTYQGHLLDENGEPVPDGDYSMDFTFYDNIIGGDVLWGPENHLVDVNDGYFAVTLGTGEDPIGADDLEATTYLEIEVSGETLSPRHLLTSVPFALVAQEVISGGVGGTTYYAGTGLDLSGTTFSITTTYRLPQACDPDELASYNGAAWVCSAPSSDVWELGGNSGTSPDNQIGTTDETAFQIVVSDTVGLTLDPVAIVVDPETGPLLFFNVIGGGDPFVDPLYMGMIPSAGVFLGSGYGNSVRGVGPVIVGGMENTAEGMFSFVGAGLQNVASGENVAILVGALNIVTDCTGSSITSGEDNEINGGDMAFIGAGENNLIESNGSAICGGNDNEISSYSSFIGSGGHNTISGGYAVIGGGEQNTISNSHGTVAGGAYNIVAASGGTVCGGDNNTVTAAGTNAIIGGGDDHIASGTYSFIGGGGSNTTSGATSAICGGSDNLANGDYGAIGGGYGNTANDEAATVGGGWANTAGWHATVSGGNGNTASSMYSTVGGGHDNTASNSYATVLGGVDNTASGAYSLAAGKEASATHQGSYVWADSQSGGYSSDGVNQTKFRAGGGFHVDVNGGHWVDIYSTGTVVISTSTGADLTVGGDWRSTSDRALKQDLQAVDSKALLMALADLPIYTWQYTSMPDVQHIGPTAQDFYQAFGLGSDDRHISTIDGDGVALAAVQALYYKVLELEARLATCQCEEVRP